MTGLVLSDVVGGLDLTLRLAGRGDTDTLLDFHAAAIAEEAGQAGLSAASDDLAALAQLAARQHLDHDEPAQDTLWLALVADLPAGMVRLQAPAASSGVRVQEVVDLTVAPSLRGRGVGSGLLCLLLNQAQARRIPRLWSRVRASNTAAIKAHRRAGFCERGRLPRHIQCAQGQIHDLIVMDMSCAEP